MQIECPHPDCGRKFDKLIMLIDQTRIPRDTYYACPHCKQRIDVIFNKENRKSSDHSPNIEKGNQESSNHSPNVKKEKPLRCPHLRQFKLFSKGAEIPDECFTCKRLTECALGL